MTVGPAPRPSRQLTSPMLQRVRNRGRRGCAGAGTGAGVGSEGVRLEGDEQLLAGGLEGAQDRTVRQLRAEQVADVT
eukprot:3936537-Rhodomonas_salina.1